MIVRLATDAMRTRFELVLAGECETALMAAGEAALEEVRLCEQRISPFLAGSLVSKINGAGVGVSVAVDGDTAEMLRAGLEVWRDSAGAFDFTVGALMRRWGMREDPGGEVDEEAPGSGSVMLDCERGQVRVLSPGLELDLGAIGKGHALDLAARVLRESGVTCGLLHGGTSSVLAIGAPEGERGWRVRVGRDGPLVTLADGEALGVSASYGRTATVGGVTVGHVMDPRRGCPAGAGVAAAIWRAERGPSAVYADAWSTALVVMGEMPAREVRELSGFLCVGGEWRQYGARAAPMERFHE